MVYDTISHPTIIRWGIWEGEWLISPAFDSLEEVQEFARLTGWKDIEMAEPKDAIRFRSHYGDINYVTKKGGVLKCTCSDFKNRKFCEHVRETHNEGYLIVDQPEPVLPDFVKLQRMAQTQMHVEHLAHAKGVQVAWLEDWSVVASNNDPFIAPEAVVPCLRGKVFAKKGLDNGSIIKTSTIVGWDTELEAVVTESGQRYVLLEPEPKYLELFPDCRERLIHHGR